MPSRYHALAVSQLPPPTLNAGISRLEEVAKTKITDDDLGEIIDAFKAKAKAGHEGAARFLIEHVLGAKYTPTAITINNFHGDDEKETHTVIGNAAAEETPLARVSIYLSAAGQATPRLIAADTGLVEAVVVRVLDDHPERFHVKGARYSLAK